MSLPTPLLLATSNPGKLADWRALLGPLGIEVRTRPDLPEVDETGVTVTDNARLKAEAACALTGWPTLADDIGLDLDRLDGAPGVRIRRWAMDLGGWPAARGRCAEVGGAGTYRCGLALCRPGRMTIVVEGSVRGTLVAASGPGPGTEPCFLPDGAPDVLPRLSPLDHAAFHHRARALNALLKAV